MFEPGWQLVQILKCSFQQNFNSLQPKFITHDSNVTIFKREKHIWRFARSQAQENQTRQTVPGWTGLNYLASIYCNPVNTALKEMINLRMGGFHGECIFMSVVKRFLDGGLKDLVIEGGLLQKGSSILYHHHITTKQLEYMNTYTKQ